jgi:error-prone DNA polymerase
MAYAELQLTTNFSFLRGASHAEEFFAQAQYFGYDAIAVTDRNSLAGIVRAHQAARQTGVRLIVGCRLDLREDLSVLVYPTDRPAYARLCRLLSRGKARAGKGKCDLGWDDLAEHAEGQIAILLPDQPDGLLATRLALLRQTFATRAYLALTLRRRPGDAQRLASLARLAATAHVATVATGDVLYHVPQRRILQDVLTCIREGTRIDDIGFRRERFADRHLRPPAEMARRFAAFPAALRNTETIADACRFSLGELRYQYPREEIDGLSAQQTLEKLTWQSAARRFGAHLPPAMHAQLQHELNLIAELQYAPYFLTVNSIVACAKAKEILCQGRGSAANSAVCYVLGITAIDPVQSNLLFERFISAERKEPPDIDVDFEHERREEVIQWIFDTYGRDRAALCATVIRYRARGAVRDVGKALGLPEDVTAALAGQVWGWSEDGVRSEHAAQLNMNVHDRRLRLTLDLARELMGFPRHLSQHPGGFVLTQDRLDDLVPIEPAAMQDRQVIEWDKDDIDILRFMKVDVLGLGMLGCMRRALTLLSEQKGIDLDLATIPQEDPATYAMIRRADTLGTFQIESRAQMSMLPRLQPRTFYDLVIEVAIVRPGPIQGEMVHPYLRRREGKEPVEFPTPELQAVLGKTLGVPLFQEQAMKVAIVCAGFSPGEADQLRRAMATFKFTGGVHKFREKLISGMIERGYAPDFAERTIKQIEGFGSYGFPESHAASFALIAYASSWMKCHHPDVFACALLNAQPMGFYAPAQIVRDAIEHGVQVRPICVNASRWDCTLEPTGGQKLAIRLGLRMVKGLANAHGATLVSHRGELAYTCIDDIHRRGNIPAGALEKLAHADAFGSLNLDRRRALWHIRALADNHLPLFAAGVAMAEPAVDIVAMPQGAAVVEDYRNVGLSLRCHPVTFLRDTLRARGFTATSGLAAVRDGRWVEIAGIVLVRQRPGSARGVMFITLEDETGHANLIVWPAVFEQNRRLILSATMIGVRGRLQREGEVTHIIAHTLTDFSDLLRGIGARDTFPLPSGRGDEAKHGGAPDPRGAVRPRDIYVANLRQTSELNVKTRDFR